MHLIILSISLLQIFVGIHSSDAVTVHLTSTSPAIYNSNLTFTATLIPPPQDYATFVFKFKVPKYDLRVKGLEQVSINEIFNKDHIGTHKVLVEVFHVWRKIATAEISYEITESIPGSIELVQNTTLNHSQTEYISTKQPLNVQQAIHDPNHFFSASQMLVTWTVDDKLIPDTTNFNYSFPTSGEHTITSTVLVYSKFSQKPLHGYFKRKVIAMDPIFNISIGGQTYLQKSEILDLTVNCSGGGSYYEYCWTVQSNPNDTLEFDCTEPTVSSSCNFHIRYYFSKPGYQLIKMYVQNSIDIKYQDIPITIYYVEPTTGLFQIILPLIAVLLSIVIIVASIIAYKRRKPSVKVEVADFDFQERLVVDQEHTFFERLSINTLRLLTCGGTLNQLFQRTPHGGIVSTSSTESFSS